MSRARASVRRRAPRAHAARAAFAAALLLAPAALRAQGPGAKVAQNVLLTTVPGVFGYALSTPPLTQSSLTGGLCSPGACYSGTVTARGNRGWQLQVKLATAPGTFTVAYVQATVPPGVQAINKGTQTWLNTATWVTVATSTSPAAGSAVGLLFNANRTSGRDGVVPTAAQLAAVLAYQVVAYP